MPSVTSAERAASDERNLHDMLLVTVFIGLLTVMGLLSVVFVAWTAATNTLSAPLLWSLALSAAAMGLGFLFGIPKVLQGKKSPDSVSANPRGTETAARNYDQRVNTNLEEISDWLTKIIVGLGLVELRQLPEYVDRLALRVGLSFGDGQAFHTVGLAMILFFMPIGFLYGYLMTRLYLQGALARAEGGEFWQRLTETSQKANAALSAAAALTARRDAQVRTAEEAATLWNSDPHRGIAGGRSEANGRKVTAEIRPITSTSPVNRVHLEVASTDPKKPLRDPVKFLLHPTFDEPEVTQLPDPDGIARLDILSEGVFTVGVEADQGATTLELDLARVPGGTAAFYNN